MSKYEDVKREMERRMPDSTFKIQKVEKANATYTGIVLISDDGICPVFAIPNDITDAEIPKFCDGVEYELAHMVKPSIPYLDILSDWEKAKGSLFVRTINYINNAEWLVENEIPHRVYGDIALVPYLEMGVCACAAVNSKICERWGILPTQILNIALENAAQFKPLVFQKMSNTVLDIIDDGNLKMLKAIRPYIVTNKEMSYGASALFYEDVLESIAAVFNDNFWILPISTEHVIVMKAPDDDGYALYKLVKGINEDIVPSDEFLSNNPLFYNRTWKQLYQYNPVTGNLDIA